MSLRKLDLFLLITGVLAVAGAVVFFVRGESVVDSPSIEGTRTTSSEPDALANPPGESPSPSELLQEESPTGGDADALPEASVQPSPAESLPAKQDPCQRFEQLVAELRNDQFVACIQVLERAVESNCRAVEPIRRQCQTVCEQQERVRWEATKDLCSQQSPGCSTAVTDVKEVWTKCGDLLLGTKTKRMQQLRVDARARNNALVEYRTKLLDAGDDFLGKVACEFCRRTAQFEDWRAVWQDSEMEFARLDDALSAIVSWCVFVCPIGLDRPKPTGMWLDFLGLEGVSADSDLGCGSEDSLELSLFKDGYRRLPKTGDETVVPCGSERWEEGQWQLFSDDTGQLRNLIGATLKEEDGPLDPDDEFELHDFRWVQEGKGVGKFALFQDGADTGTSLQVLCTLQFRNEDWSKKLEPCTPPFLEQMK